MTTLHNHLDLRFMPESAKTSEQFPDYKIYAVGSMGRETVIGAAWKKTKHKSGGEEFEFLSITIDDPSFPDQLNLAAFQNKQGGWDITWRRRQSAA